MYVNITFNDGVKQMKDIDDAKERTINPGASVRCVAAG